MASVYEIQWRRCDLNTLFSICVDNQWRRRGCYAWNPAPLVSIKSAWPHYLSASVKWEWLLYLSVSVRWVWSLCEFQLSKCDFWVTLSEVGVASVSLSGEVGVGYVSHSVKWVWPLCHTQQSGHGRCVSFGEVCVASMTVSEQWVWPVSLSVEVGLMWSDILCLIFRLFTESTK